MREGIVIVMQETVAEWISVEKGLTLRRNLATAQVASYYENSDELSALP